MAIKVIRHEYTSATLRALLAKARDLTGIINAVELQCRQLHLLVLVVRLFRLGVVLFLALLG